MTKKHSTAKTVPAKSKRITEIRALIGHDVVLIPNHPGTKRPTQNKWSSLTHSAMMDPKHIRALERGNIGVLLGKASGHLCAVDIDLDELVAPFIAANPFLKRTLQTHGARGCYAWTAAIPTKL